ncbi:MAG: FUSC family protein [Verrucomicrobia bacterium]|nr:FUSC family protein [Verrucomicrobiota bacterium]
MTVGQGQKLVTALTCWLAAVAALNLHLQNPWWAAISAWVLASADRTALAQKAVLRIFGTVLGCLLGCVLAIELEPSPVGQLLALFLIGFVANYFHSISKYAYAWVVGSVSALLLLATSMTVTGTVLQNMAVYRGLEIICGVVAASIGDAVLVAWFRASDFAKDFGELSRTASSFAKATEDKSPAQPKNKPAVATAVSAADLKIAVASGLSAIAIPLLWLIFQLPEIAQSLVTALVTLQGDKSQSRNRGSQRIAGCLLGGALGLLFALTGFRSFGWWSITFVAGLTIMAILHVSTSRFAYLGTQGGVAFIMALVSENGPPENVWPALSRLSGMVLGVVITIVILHLVELVAEHAGRRARVARSR